MSDQSQVRCPKCGDTHSVLQEQTKEKTHSKTDGLTDCQDCKQSVPLLCENCQNCQQMMCEDCKTQSTSACMSALINKPFQQQKQVNLESCPNRIRLIKKQLWSCQDNKCIQIFNYDLQLQRTLSKDHWDFIKDVAEMPHGNLVIACGNGLYEITASGEEVCQIDSDAYGSADFYKNRLYACPFSPYLSNQPTVRVYEYNGLWNKENELELRFTGGTLVTISVRHDQIIVCSYDDHKLITMSLTGEVLQTYRKKGSVSAGEFNWPYLCNQDENGMLLIADRYNHRLQTVDKEGHWNVVQMQPRLEHPCGAVYIDNKLFVGSQGGGYRLSLYT